MPRRRRSTQSPLGKLLEIIVALVFLWIMVGVVIPALAQNYADKQIDRLRATPVTSAH